MFLKKESVPPTDASSSRTNSPPSKHACFSTPNKQPIVIIDPIDDDRTDKNGSDSGHDNQSSSSLPLGKEFSPIPTAQLSNEGSYLTVKEFNYTMTLLDNKINTLYKLCRYISDNQQESSKTLKKLVVEDELSDTFWNVSFQHIVIIYFIFSLK